MGWYKITDTTSGEVQYVASLAGVAVDEYVVLELSEDRAPEGLEEVDEKGNIFVPLASLQDAAWEKAKAAREDKLAMAVTPFGPAQTDLESMVKINGLVSMALIAKGAGLPFQETFTMADNTEVSMDADQVIRFGVAVGQHVAGVYAWAREQRAAIYAADATLDSVDAVAAAVDPPAA